MRTAPVTHRIHKHHPADGIALSQVYGQRPSPKPGDGRSYVFALAGRTLARGGRRLRCVLAGANKPRHAGRTLGFHPRIRSLAPDRRRPAFAARSTGANVSGPGFPGTLLSKSSRSRLMAVMPKFSTRAKPFALTSPSGRLPHGSRAPVGQTVDGFGAHRRFTSSA
jgi:hypothetical protein